VASRRQAPHPDTHQGRRLRSGRNLLRDLAAHDVNELSGAYSGSQPVRYSLSCRCGKRA
jgi:hypothetical protein